MYTNIMKCIAFYMNMYMYKCSMPVTILTRTICRLSNTHAQYASDLLLI